MAVQRTDGNGAVRQILTGVGNIAKAARATKSIPVAGGPSLGILGAFKILDGIIKASQPAAAAVRYATSITSSRSSGIENQERGPGNHVEFVVVASGLGALMLALKAKPLSEFVRTAISCERWDAIQGKAHQDTNCICE